jgi:hypothetical protein
MRDCTASMSLLFVTEMLIDETCQPLPSKTLR